MTNPLRSRTTSTPTAPQSRTPDAPDAPPPRKVEVTLGARTITVHVLAAEEARLAKLLGDGDLGNDLARIAAGGGDPATLEPGDFVLAGFDPRQAALFAELGRRVTPFSVDLAKLDEPTRRAFGTIVWSKDYLASVAAAPDDAQRSQRLSTHLAALPPAARDAALAGLAHEVAMLLVRDEERAFAWGQGDGRSAAPIERTLRDPDLPLSEKHAALAAAGEPSIDARSARIEGVRAAQLAKIRERSQGIYQALGGVGSIGETITLATGSGIETQGLAGQRNRAIGFLDYGRPTAAPGTDPRRLDGLRTQQKTFSPTDWSRPVTFQLGVFGADAGFSGNSIVLSRKSSDGTVKSYELDVRWSGGKTVLSPKDPKAFGAEATFDPRGQTITFAAGSEPITVRQRSGEGWGQLDEIGLTLSAVNASSEAPSLTVELRELFEPGRFDVAATRPDVLARVHQQLDAAAAYVALHPELELSVALAALGPVDWDGTRPATELETYGPDGDRYSRDNLVELRSSRLTVRFDAGKTGAIDVEASTDPVRANLSGPRTTLLTPRGRALVAELEARSPGLTDNDVLSAMRAFAVLELFDAKLAERGLAGVAPGRRVKLGATEVSFEDYRKITAELRVR
ncbi:hypothetical protein L6R52_18335 [Myxococcota bacterium]|nr:hypothetical protein [Myxococcota bacterium]